MFPALDLSVEGVSRTGRVHHLPVALQSEVGLQVPGAHCAGGPAVPQLGQGALRRQRGRVVSDEGDPVADGVVSQGVGPLPEPAAALVQVAVGAYHKAGTAAPGVFRGFD